MGGKAVTHEKLSQALELLASKYQLATQNSDASAQWIDTVIVDVKNNFSLFRYEQLFYDQIQSLKQDLFNPFRTALED